MFNSVLTAALCLAVGDSAALRPSFLNPTRAPLQALAAPSIQITSMPAWGENGSISGVVRGTSPANCAVAVYIHVEGAGWWTKPTLASPTATVRSDGAFTANVTTGGLDAYATIFCADLIPAGSSPTHAAGSPSLPANPQSMARHCVERHARTLEFAGRSWGVKSSPGPVGPGGNVFSHDPSDVWVDTQGQLHLTIQHHDGRWWATEVILLESLGHGTYWFVTESEVEDLDANATFGAFIWDAYGGGSIPDAPNREIDFEDSKWGNPNSSTNSQAVVQPYSVPGNLMAYTISDLSAGPTLTRFFEWQPDQLQFTTALGEHTRGSIPPEDLVFRRTYRPDPALDHRVPAAGRERFRFNLWLNDVELGGAPPPKPAQDERIELVVRDFRFMAEPSARLLDGETGSSSQWGSGWLDLATPTDFAKGTRLRVSVGGTAKKIFVRLLAKGVSADSSRGIVGGAVTVPENRVVEVRLDVDRKGIKQISVHGGPNPWNKPLGPTNGPATLEAVELIQD